MTEYITQERALELSVLHPDYHGLCLAAIQTYRDSLVAGVVLPEPDFKYQRYDDTPEVGYYTADQMQAAYRAGMQAQWQPIDTAPTDGTYVLIYGHDSECVEIGNCEDGFGWWSQEGPRDPAPTHWMPIPQPPKDTP